MKRFLIVSEFQEEISQAKTLLSLVYIRVGFLYEGFMTSKKTIVLSSFMNFMKWFNSSK